MRRLYRAAIVHQYYIAKRYIDAIREPNGAGQAVEKRAEEKEENEVEERPFRTVFDVRRRPFRAGE
jgi:hypothetical protein